MSAPLKKPRHARNDRSYAMQAVSSASSITKKGESDDGSHLWVISYADLLMVLLCFFVLFFSTDKTKRDSVIHRILATTESGSETIAAQPIVQTPVQTQIPVQVQVQPPQKVTSPPLPSVSHSIIESLSDLDIETKHDGESLMIEFPDNAYLKGRAALTPQYKMLLFKILTRLSPYSNEINLVFVGHTDSDPIHRKTQRISDNIDLSSERAKYALFRAQRMGFPVDHLRVEADASARRQSRTLSISILERGGKS